MSRCRWEAGGGGEGERDEQQRAGGDQRADGWLCMRQYKRHVSLICAPLAQHGARLVLAVLLLPLDNVVALAAQADVRNVGDFRRHRTVLVVVKGKLVLMHGRRTLLLLAQAVGGHAGGHGSRWAQSGRLGLRERSGASVTAAQRKPAAQSVRAFERAVLIGLSRN